MAGQVYKRCTRCPRRARYREGDRRCPACGATVFSWYFKVDVGRTADGRRLQEKRGGFKTKTEAERALREVLSKLDRSAYVEPSNLTLAQFLQEEWLPAIRPPRLAEKTYRDRRLNVDKYIVPRIGSVRLQELSAVHLNRLYADLLAEGRTQSPGGLSPTTVRNIHVQLHKALSDAVKWGRAEHNPAQHADPPSTRTVVARRKAAMRTWTAAELAQFLEYTRDTLRYPLWRLAAYTGMRRSELLGLPWEAVDLKRGQLAVVATAVLVRDGEAIDGARQKSTRSRRTIALGPGTVAALEEHATVQRQRRQAAGSAWQEAGLVFTNPIGGYLHPNGVRRDFLEAAERAGVPRIRFHDLRHTHASLMLQAGVNPKVVAERLGHTSVSFTLDTYAHVIPSMQRDAVDRFEDLIEGELDEPEEPDSEEGEDR